MLYVDLFKPKTTADLIYSERVRNQIGDGTSNHMLFYGLAGMGKSLTAEVVTSKYSSKYFNCGVSGKMETLRGEITDFCENVSLDYTVVDSSIKFVILDEIDSANISDAFYDALRGFMNTYQSKVRFIATCNDFSRIPDPLRSRFTCIDFNPKDNAEEEELYSKYKSRIDQIYKICKLEMSEDVLESLCDKSFPDFRKPLQVAQHHRDNKIKNVTLDSINTAVYKFIELFDAIYNQMDIVKLHQLIMGEYHSTAQEAIKSLSDDLFDYAHQEKNVTDLTVLLHIPIIIAEYADMLKKGVDRPLCLKGCVFKLYKLFSKLK